MVFSKMSWGDRGDEFKKRAESIARFFSRYDEIKDSITYVFNKFSPDQIKQLSSDCENILDRLTTNEKGNTNLCAILEDVYKAIKDPKEFTVFDYQQSKEDFKQ